MEQNNCNQKKLNNTNKDSTIKNENSSRIPNQYLALRKKLFEQKIKEDAFLKKEQQLLDKIKEEYKQKLDKMLPNDVEYFQKFERKRNPSSINSQFSNPYNILQKPKFQDLNPKIETNDLDSFQMPSFRKNTGTLNLSSEISRDRSSSQKQNDFDKSTT